MKLRRAKLIDSNYEFVAFVTVSSETDWPTTILYEGRVFLYYPETRPVPDPKPEDRFYRLEP